MNQLWMPNDSLGGLPILKDAVSKREFSYDKIGRDRDHWVPEEGETVTVMDTEGYGCIKHIWLTAMCGNKYFLREILPEMYWDGEKTPNAYVSSGDFLGVGHGCCKHYTSLSMNMVFAKDRRGPKGTACMAINCYLPMPFGKKAATEIKSEPDVRVENLFFMIDYEMYQEELPDYHDRFHAQFRHKSPCREIEYPKSVGKSSAGDLLGLNLGGKENHVILDVKGGGHYVGYVLSIDNIGATNQGYTWPGEGDDMIFIDGEIWPLSLHGIGTEDCFGAAWGYPSDEYAGPYHGITLFNDRYECYGKSMVYRWHTEDPAHLQKSILVTIEHDHADGQGNEYSSAGYWYQQELHAQSPLMESTKERCAWSIPLNIQEGIRADGKISKQQGLYGRGSQRMLEEELGDGKSGPGQTQIPFLSDVWMDE